MAGWLSRLLGGDGESKDAKPKNSTRAPAPNPFPLSTPAPAPVGPASGAAPQVAAIHRFAVRRPLVGRNGEMAGFEFRLARNLEQRLQARPDVSVQAAYVVTLLSSMQSTLEAGREAPALDLVTAVRMSTVKRNCVRLRRRKVCGKCSKERS